MECSKVVILLSLLFCLPAQLLSLELVNFNWLYFELCMLMVTISYHYDIVMLTVTIMITIGYGDSHNYHSVLLVID